MNLKNSNISFAMHFWVGGNTRKCPNSTKNGVQKIGDFLQILINGLKVNFQSFISDYVIRL